MDMQDLLKKLIRFKSDKNNPDEIKRCIGFVASYLKKAGLKVKVYSHKGVPSLIAAQKLKKHYQYILNGHLDVVPADYKNAFKPTIKGSKLYGRGAADMKGVTTAMIEVLKEPDLKSVDIAIMLTGDEEIGGYNGVGYLVNKLGYNCDCVIAPDGGNYFQLILAEKGVLHIEFKAKGKASHGSSPWKGVNALEILISVWQEINKKFKKTTEENRWLPTVNLGKMVGGDATNKVPTEAKMYLDFRYPKRAQKQKILNLIRKACKKNKVTFKIESDGDILFTPKNNKYVKKILKAANETKIIMTIDKCSGASDARFFSSKGIPVIMFKCYSSDAHINNEWVDLKSLEKFYKLLKLFLSQP